MKFINYISRGVYFDFNIFYNIQILYRDYVKKFNEAFILLLEHAPVYTIGRNKYNLYLNSSISYIYTDRGGMITYHGPGQIIIYPILSLKSYGFTVGTYVKFLEDIMFEVAIIYNLNPIIIDKKIGLWIISKKDNLTYKIGSIGIRICNGITVHGLAFNNYCNLEYFNKIIPCGIEGVRMTSLYNELSCRISMLELSSKFISIFKRKLNL